MKRPINVILEKIPFSAAKELKTKSFNQTIHITNEKIISLHLNDHRDDYFL